MTRSRIWLCVGMALIASLVTACGSASNGSAGTSGSSDNGISQKSAADIVQAMQKALSSAKSYHIKGTITTNGETISMDLTTKVPKGLKGTIGVSGKGSSQLITNDGQTFYITPDDAFWASNPNPAAAQLFSGRCFLANTNSGASFGDLAKFSSFSDISQLLSSASALTDLTKGSVTTVEGQKIIPLNDSSGTELDVATTGTPLPVQLKSTGSDPGSLSFDQWNQNVTISLPTGCIDVGKLQQSPGLGSSTPGL